MPSQSMIPVRRHLPIARNSVFLSNLDHELGYYDYDPEPEEPAEFPRDTVVDDAKTEIADYFTEHPNAVFYERQLEVILEKRYFHWITSKALHELVEEGNLASDRLSLENVGDIRFYFSKALRYWKRQANQILALVTQFSAPEFTRALGAHGEAMFDAALPTVGFLPGGRKIRSYEGRTWTVTNHDLDRVFLRDGIAYGVEIKNTLKYIPFDELTTKLSMCAVLGLTPLFILRMAPKSYIELIRQRGGFTLVFQYHLYPFGFDKLAEKVRTRLLIPADSPVRIADGTVTRFLNWHLRRLQTPPQREL